MKRYIGHRNLSLGFFFDKCSDNIICVLMICHSDSWVKDGEVMWLDYKMETTRSRQVIIVAE
jgi:hypothetical protein